MAWVVTFEFEADLTFTDLVKLHVRVKASKPQHIAGMQDLLWKLET